MNKSFSKTISKTISKIIINYLPHAIDDPDELKKAIKKMKKYPKSKEGKAFDKQMNNAKYEIDNKVAVCYKLINDEGSIIQYIRKGFKEDLLTYIDYHLDKSNNITKVVFSLDRLSVSEYYWTTKDIFKLISNL